MENEKRDGCIFPESRQNFPKILSFHGKKQRVHSKNKISCFGMGKEKEDPGKANGNEGYHFLVPNIDLGCSKWELENRRDREG